jgi:hypothetical protein
MFPPHFLWAIKNLVFLQVLLNEDRYGCNCDYMVTSEAHAWAITRDDYRNVVAVQFNGERSLSNA